jgi:glycerophosphoryl diester phosphodiesterase
MRTRPFVSFMVFVASATALGVLGPVPSAPAAPEAFDLQAHRGGRGETTEESLRAFAKSLELGVSTLELDIVITKDHQPLVWHDPIIDPAKCADTAPAFAGDPQYPYVGKLVHDLTLVQIRTLDCGKLLATFPDAQVVRNNESPPCRRCSRSPTRTGPTSGTTSRRRSRPRNPRTRPALPNSST